jgi:hypothetical protein
LVGLLSSIDGVAHAVAADDPVPPHDAWLPLLSVAGALHVDATSIPATVPYLRVDAPRREAASRMVAARHRRLAVGLAWAGNREHVNDRRRSIALASLAPLLEIADVGWFSLQKGAATDEIAAVAAAANLVPMPPQYDLDDTAALIEALDLVVTVDTSIAHLAGALARPTWVMLPFAADWRWGVERSDSAWYPTMRLFRQHAIGDWDGVVRGVASGIVEVRAARR